ncbi:hypothetical protein A2W14_04360 [Candidatus Gottesmanbacteria bacterium RBG_16_37_8]|uniref:EamA domain-containing protein n=1 Tax=Candidatus Gottesmanbacteria bacterium RBG_16_37_8 TaxID=1798371 RepID=A0A1F5YS99_9BACT|nr:MAG: hypothetical protein A2W14_04360 [Candidatus Gottesmanbacteria bacterium RBG_16_37_8]
MSAHQKGILALIVANIIWGAASPIFKFALQNISPFTLAFIRFYGAALILLPLAYPYLKIHKKDYLKIFWLSFFGVTVNISFFFLGLKYAPSINAPIIASSGPIFIYLFSIFLLKEKPHFKVLLGLIVSLIGVFVIIGQPFLEGNIDGQLIGNLFLILATLGSVGHIIISKEIVHNYQATTIAFWSFLIGTITFLPFFIWEIMAGNNNYALDHRGVIGIVFGIFLSSALAYTLFEYGIKYINAQDVGIFTYIDPLAAILIAAPLLGEHITSIYLLGAILVFGGIFIAEGRLHYHPFHRFKS